MKILLLAPHPFFQPRGTPLAVRTVLEFLSARGHEVDVLTLHEGEDVDIPNVRIFRIPRVPGIRNVRPGFSLKKVVCDAVMFGSCMRMVRRTRYDLIHAVEESAFIAAAARSVAGVPYVYDMDSSLAEQLVEAYPWLQLTLPVLRFCESVAVRRSLGVLTVCAALEDVALGHDPAKPVGRVEDSTLLPPAGSADGNGTGPIPEAVRSAGPIAMYVGNLERYQGIDLLLEGFQHTLRRIPTASLVIVGGREDDIGRYRGVAGRLGIQARVHFLGPRPVSLLPELLRQADVLVSPRLKGLNTPMKIYSYLDSGTAVLATRLRTHTQVLDDRTAYLVDPAPESLGAGLAELLSDETMRRRLADNAKEYVQEEFTPAAAQRKLGIFYDRMEAKAVGARA
ncbi:MAG TPA: glycosyltransferase family 4 protein [Gemmatimonadales bacterium]|nr:glycosyltransferase family 4 protein [Gemmatimonadales bacterium]